MTMERECHTTRIVSAAFDIIGPMYNLLCRKMLVQGNGMSCEYEYNKILHRIGGSQSDILGFSYIHKVAIGLVQADMESVANHDTRELNHKDSQGRSPLHWAALRANEAAVRALLRARVNVQAKDYEGKTALHCAAISRSQRCIELLLIAGSEVAAKDQIGYQPLHWQ